MELLALAPSDRTPVVRARQRLAFALCITRDARLYIHDLPHLIAQHRPRVAPRTVIRTLHGGA